METEKCEEEDIKLEEKHLRLPIFWVAILGLISLIAISWGTKIEIALLFFATFSFILGIFFYFVREDEFEPVEKDLEVLDEEGEERRV